MYFGGGGGGGGYNPPHARTQATEDLIMIRAEQQLGELGIPPQRKLMLSILDSHSQARKDLSAKALVEIYCDVMLADEGAATPRTQANQPTTSPSQRYAAQYPVEHERSRLSHPMVSPFSVQSSQSSPRLVSTDEVKRLQRRVTELERDTTMLDNTNRTLQAEKESLRSKLKQSENEQAAQSKSLQDLDKYKKYYTYYKAKLAEKETALHTAQQQLEAANRSRPTTHSLDAQLESLRSQLEQSKESLQEHVHYVAKVQPTIDSYKKSSMDYKAKFLEKETALHTAQQQLEAAKRSKVAAETSASTLQHKIVEIKQQYAALQLKFDTVQRQWEAHASSYGVRRDPYKAEDCVKTTLSGDVRIDQSALSDEVEKYVCGHVLDLVNKPKEFNPPWKLPIATHLHVQFREDLLSCDQATIVNHLGLSFVTDSKLLALARDVLFVKPSCWRQFVCRLHICTRMPLDFERDFTDIFFWFSKQPSFVQTVLGAYNDPTITQSKERTIFAAATAKTMIAVHETFSNTTKDVLQRILDNVVEPCRELSKSKTGLDLQSRFKAVVCGKEQVPIIFNKHANDPQRFEDIVILPSAEELAVPLDKKLQLPEADLPLLHTLRFSPTLQSPEQLRERQFRLLREEALVEVRKAYSFAFRQPTPTAAATANNQSPDGARQLSCQMSCSNIPTVQLQKRRTTGCVATLQQDGTVQLEGTIVVSNQHPLAKALHKSKRIDAVNFLKDSASLFKSGTLVFVRVYKERSHQPTVITGIVEHIRKYPELVEYRSFLKEPANRPQTQKHRNKQQQQQHTHVAVLVKLLLTDVSSFDGLAVNTNVQCDVHGTRIDWRESAIVLRGLQHTRILPFAKLLLNANNEENQLPQQVPNPYRLGIHPQHSQSALSEMQLAAIDAALSRKVTIIQGPPGTGKTHVGRKIVSALLRAGETVAIISYKNHALDQLLSLLLKDGVVDRKRAVRFGSGCKDEIVKDLCSNKSTLDPPPDGKFYGKNKKKKEMLLDELERTCLPLEALDALKGQGLPAETSLPFLVVAEKELVWMERAQDEDRRQSRRSQFPDADELYLWKRFKNGDSSSGVLKTREYLSHRELLFSLSRDQRRVIIDAVEKWTAAHRDDVIKQLQFTRKALDDHKLGVTADHLHDKRLIGCTISFAAKNYALIAKLLNKPKTTLLVEESGELLESHMLTCLPQHLGRLVMIGDHKQLPPKVTHHKLQKTTNCGFDLNCSMFERLILAGMDHIMLDIQHRMFSQLGTIVKNLSYPDLRNAPEIQAAKSKPVPGTRNQLFFLNHSFKEGGVSEFDDNTATKTNQQEGALVVKFAWYLTRQGVKPSDIAIISPYLGQVKLLQRLLEREDLSVDVEDADRQEMLNQETYEDDIDTDQSSVQQTPTVSERGGVRIATIDNFQGEESKIVLVSLVRSNDRNDIGWVRDLPRVTVMLSRAKQGLYLFGNKDTFVNHRGENAWQKALRPDLWPEDCVGTALPLWCSSHRVETAVSTAEELSNKCPNGSCDRICGRKLTGCNHLCKRHCHKDDTNHVKQICKEEVLYDRCQYGHKAMIECHELQDSTFRCPTCKKLEREEQERKKREQAAKAKHELALQALHDKEKRLEEQRKAQEAQRQRDATRIEQEALLKKKEADDKYQNAVEQLRNKERAEDLQKQLDTVKKAHEATLKQLEKEAAATRQKALDNIEEEKAKLAAEETRQAKEVATLKQSFAEAAAQRNRNHQAKMDRVRQEGKMGIERLERQREEQEKLDRKRNEEALKLHREKQRREEEVLKRGMPNLDRDTRLDDEQECCTCCSEFKLKDLCRCNSGHFFCKDCFENMIADQVEGGVRNTEGEAICVLCRGDPEKKDFLIPHQLVQTFIPRFYTETFDNYRLGVKQGVAEKGVEQRLRKEIENENQNDAIVKHLQNMMITRCPKKGCGTPFSSYENCSALVCSECRTDFCALCLKICSAAECHGHVARCTFNPQPGEVYHHVSVFNQLQKQRWRRLQQAFMREKHPNIGIERQHLIWGCVYPGEPFPTEQI